MTRRFFFGLAAVSAAVGQGPIGVVNPNGPYNALNLTQYHIGAGVSYETVPGPGPGDSFYVNGSLFDAQHSLVDLSIIPGVEATCCVVNEPVYLSPNSGPLECGISHGPNDFCQAYPGTLLLGMAYITAWFVCTVQSGMGNSYNTWVPNTVVGVFSGDTSPSGPGIQNCTSIAALQLGGVPNDTTSSTMPAPNPTASTNSSTSSSSSSSTPFPTMSASNTTTNSSMTTITVTTQLCPVCEYTTYVTICPVTAVPSPAPTPIPVPVPVPQPGGSSTTPTSTPTIMPYQGAAASLAGWRPGLLVGTAILLVISM